MLGRHVFERAQHPIGMALGVPAQGPAAQPQPTQAAVGRGIGHTERQVDVGVCAAQMQTPGQLQGRRVVRVDQRDELRHRQAIGRAGQQPVERRPGGVGVGVGVGVSTNAVDRKPVAGGVKLPHPLTAGPQSQLHPVLGLPRRRMEIGHRSGGGKYRHRQTRPGRQTVMADGMAKVGRVNKG